MLNFAPLAKSSQWFILQPLLQYGLESGLEGGGGVQAWCSWEENEREGERKRVVLFFRSTWHFNKLQHPEHSDKQGLASLPQHWLFIVDYVVDPCPGNTGQIRQFNPQHLGLVSLRHGFPLY